MKSNKKYYNKSKMKQNSNIYILLIILILFIIVIFYALSLKNETFKNKKVTDIKLNIQTVLIIKENIPFLREWIIYHLNLGFDKIYLYDNTGSIGIDDSSTNNNKYNFKFNEIINIDVDNELNKILNDFKDNVIYVKWQPKDENGNIIYGQNESIGDYIKKYHTDNDTVTYTAYIDVDEFIFSPDNVNVKSLIIDKHNNDFSRIIIQQKKFIDRFCGGAKKVIDMVNTIENIDTSSWGPKNIIDNSKINIDNIVNIHIINVKEGNTETLPQHILRFNHYNINNKQIKWMKDFYKRTNDFESGIDKSMSRYKNMIDENCKDKCSDKNNMINYQKNNKELCYFNSF